MAHDEGASETLVAIHGRLDRMDIKIDGIHDSLEWHREMLKFHGHHFNRLEATLAEHGDMLREHDRRFDQIDIRFDQVDETLQKILVRLDAPRP
jgi:pimeloyl-CoA synthetase